MSGVMTMERNRGGDRPAKVSRRRVITIVGAAAGLALTAAPLRSLFAAPPGPTVHRWRGRALGAEASMVLHHPDGAVAERLFGLCAAEIERLEREFSLYREDSALRLLNRTGVLRHPGFAMLRLLAESQRYGGLSDGAFDPTVQPLWRLYERHFAGPVADPAGPPAAAIDAARRLVDYRAVDIGAKAIVLGRPAMAVTLNGIAQGYITDRIADLLRAHGVRHVLVDLGEIRAVGSNGGEGRPWRIGLRHPRRSEVMVGAIDLVDRAVATSAGAGTPFTADGRHHHLFDPRTGRSANHYASVTVVADSATQADALSTALYATGPAAAPRLVAAVGNVTAYLTLADGRSLELRS